MNPNGETGLQLPPVVEQAQPASNGEVQPGARAEQAPAAPERASGPAHPAASVPLPPISLPVLPQSPSNAQASTQTGTSTAPTTADDSDLIEKEWVNKAKQIVERTKDDPFKQSEELTLVKADYMKKRYGKALKLST